MAVKHLCTITFLLLSTTIGFAQSSNLKKYWIYKERNNDYLFNSLESGCGLPANYRQLNDLVLLPIPSGGPARPSWADAAWNLGYWIGTLAMEYKLLHDKGMDVSKTKEELYYAIYAMGRLDQSAEGVWGCSPSNSSNGFFLRDDVPSDFTQHADALNSSLVPPPDNFRIKCIESAYVDYDNHESEMSHDHLVGLYIGMALVKKLMPESESYGGLTMVNGNSSFVNEVRAISKNIIQRLTNHGWIYWNPCKNRPVKGIYNTKEPDYICHIPGAENECLEEQNFQTLFAPPLNLPTIALDLFQLYQNMGSGICLDNGGALAFPQAIGFAAVNKFIQQGSLEEIPAAALLLSLNLASITNPNPLALDPLIFPYRDAWNIAHVRALSDGERLFATLVALSGQGKYIAGIPQSQDRVAKYLVQHGTQNHFEHLILLHQLFHGPQFDDGNPIGIDNSFYDCLLNAAPCRGFDGFANSPSYNWGCASSNRLEGGVGCAEAHLGNSSAKSGLDYMFYYNLRCLTNASMEAEYQPIPIKHLSLFEINKEGYDEFDLKNFYAFNKITAGANSSGVKYRITSDPNEGNGRVNFVVNPTGTIVLKDGFEVVNGGFFHAFSDPEIDHFDCSYDPNAVCTAGQTYRLSNVARDEEEENALTTPSEIPNFSFSLLPNPSAGNTRLQFTLSETSTINITVTNIYGQTIKEFVNDPQEAGVHENILEGDLLSAGVYFCTFTSTSSTGSKKEETKKLVVLR